MGRAPVYKKQADPIFSKIDSLQVSNEKVKIFLSNEKYEH